MSNFKLSDSRFARTKTAFLIIFRTHAVDDGVVGSFYCFVLSEKMEIGNGFAETAVRAFVPALSVGMETEH